MAKANPNPPLITKQDIDRFWKHVDKSPGQGPNGDCWQWVYFWRFGAIQTNPTKDYPSFVVKGPDGRWRRIKATQLSFLLTTGKWPTLLMLHRCDNPPCVRPLHLFEGTDADNVADMVKKGRHASVTRPDWRANITKGIRATMKRRLSQPINTIPRGSRNGRAKFTAQDVQVVRLLGADGRFSQRAIARYFSVRPQLIGEIIGKLCWIDVPDADPAEVGEELSQACRVIPTHQSHIAIGTRHGAKTHPESILRGSDRSLARLHESDIPQIRELWHGGEFTQAEIADRFGVSQSAIGQIVRGRTWSHVA